MKVILFFFIVLKKNQKIMNRFVIYLYFVINSKLFKVY